MIDEQGLIKDGLSGCEGTGTAWTYNQGAHLQGLASLYEVTLNEAYLQDAFRTIDAVMSQNSGLCPNGTLEETCDEDRTCNHDQRQFKGVFVRNLAYFIPSMPSKFAN